jgi:murein hydrolase activator
MNEHTTKTSFGLILYPILSVQPTSVLSRVFERIRGIQKNIMTCTVMLVMLIMLTMQTSMVTASTSKPKNTDSKKNTSKAQNSSTKKTTPKKSNPKNITSKGKFGNSGVVASGKTTNPKSDKTQSSILSATKKVDSNPVKRTTPKQRQEQKTPQQIAEAKSLAQRKKELNTLQKNINSDRVKIDALSAKETATLQSLTKIQQHSQKQRRYLDLLQEEIDALQDKASTAKDMSQSTSGELWKLRQRYSTLVKNIAMSSANSLPPLMTASDNDHSIIVEGSLGRITRNASGAMKSLSSKRDSLSIASSKLMTASEMRTALLTLRNQEQARLDKSMAYAKKQLELIRNNKKETLANLKKEEQSAESVRKMIASMVTKEERLSKKGQTSSSVTNASSVPTGGVFKQANLPSPVGSKKILHGFGTYRNQLTNTQTNNPGIDIAVQSGTPVCAIAEGTVSHVDWLPGYGSLVILDHKNGFRTVYANLSQTSVKKGQSITNGQSIGKSGESVDGEFVHLEIWHNRTRLNPMTYLR